MTANISTMSFTPTGADTTRSLGAWSADMFFNVKNFGAIGDGSHDDTTAIQNCLDAAFGSTASPHGASFWLNNPVFFPSGRYKITSPLTMKWVRGGHIFGAGRLSTTITNTAGGSVFMTNGCDYSKFELMQLVTSSTGVCFDLDWDNTSSGASAALQSNSFCDMYFSGGAYGVRIGQTGFMGSENLFLNCYFANQTTAGLSSINGNALMNSVIGGNFAGCAKGIYAAGGSIPFISGVSFQNNNEDIGADNSTPDVYFISGCRNENALTSGTVFCRMQNGATAHITACEQLALAPCTFGWIQAPAVGTGVMIVDGCYSTNGIFVSNGTLYIRGNPGTHTAFPNANYLATFSGTVAQNI